MSNCFLVVKTGQKGCKVNDLYSTEVITDDHKIRLAGDFRLAGNWMRAVIEEVKSSLGRGSYGVFYHTTEDVEELLKDYQRCYLMLKNNVNWIPVAKVNLTSDELSKITKEASNEGYDLLAKQNFIRFTSKNRFEFVNYDEHLSNRLQTNANRLYVREFIAAHTAKKIGEFVEYL